MFDKFSTGNFYLREQGTGNREQGTGNGKDWGTGNEEGGTHRTHQNNKTIKSSPLP
jgi:hypothetical protein